MERCDFCDAREGEECRLPSEVGCDRPSVLAEMETLLDEMLSGDLLRAHQAYYAEWERAWLEQPAYKREG